jgi:hypothetical protein
MDPLWVLMDWLTRVCRPDRDFPSIRDTVTIKAAALGDDSILYGALAMIDDMLKT